MEWSNQDFIIEKMQNKINNLRNAAYIAEKGKDVMLQRDKEEIEKYTEFKVRLEDYTKQADFLEEILLDINCAKEEEIKQFEEAEQDLREKRYEAYI
ncbi:hypothetical protein [Terrisporobacter hibernicus]|uniref:Uncharacterized protein n=1 Tax=Terrisporobacter hibernicus TaxID=2813371 RepID=A0AAX2ZIN3_9FIRM|nr:hypothetical protein [Terrisporobacter hibernicus]UEL47542.1 hypothetical protein JW646_18270 [Terrisporobacter hibernicus]